jgi:hypothetical protein
MLFRRVGEFAARYKYAIVGFWLGHHRAHRGAGQG